MGPPGRGQRKIVSNRHMGLRVSGSPLAAMGSHYQQNEKKKLSTSTKKHVTRAKAVNSVVLCHCDYDRDNRYRHKRGQIRHLISSSMFLLGFRPLYFENGGKCKIFVCVKKRYTEIS